MPPQPKPRHNIVRLFVTLLVLAGALWVIVNRQYVIDQITVWQYKPSSDIASIASRSTMSDAGKFYFYASRPEVDDRAAFNTQCSQLIEKTAVLGCYVNRQIFVFNVTDTRLDGVREVTAAHEMLHAAYDRLSPSEQTHVDTLIEAQAKNITDEKLKERLALYDQTEPGERLNELHSILGTEIKTLSPELEKYYGQYFTDRAALVSLSDKYETVFQQLEDQQKALVDELNSLADQINNGSKSYQAALATLQADIDTFNARAKRGDFTSQSAFNTERAQLLARVSDVTSQREQINTMIADYGTKKKELDALNTTAEGLQHSIDSTLPAAPTL